MKNFVCENYSMSSIKSAPEMDLNISNETTESIATLTTSEVEAATAELAAIALSGNSHNREPVAVNASPNKAFAKEESDEVVNTHFGKCKWFNVAKGWGFITPYDGGQEVFVHQSVIQMSGFRSLGEEEEVEFTCKLTERGLEAECVSGTGGEDCQGSTFRPRINKKNNNNKKKKNYSRTRCYNCGEFAKHIASKCSLGPQPKRCHQCKKEDHIFANCPERREDERITSASTSANESSFTILDIPEDDSPAIREDNVPDKSVKDHEPPAN